MKENSENLPVIIGLIMLSVVSLGIGALMYSFARSDTFQKQTENSADFAQKNSQLEEKESDKNILVAPAPVENGGMAGVDANPRTHIPTGTYSNPPTTVNSFEYSDSSRQNSPLNDFGSSVERNRLSQQNNINTTIPDYSRPSSSNNFNQTDDNSLIDPLEDDNFLEIPNSNNDEEPTGITSIEESPLE
ncbi:MAG: hypothetical protein QNJ53_10660 [Pleurocapsa sp. MO_192.B19]|nr:hypothetical protein [Pleurocapsa sp. MO_192.B19]